MKTDRVDDRQAPALPAEEALGISNEAKELLSLEPKQWLEAPAVRNLIDSAANCYRLCDTNEETDQKIKELIPKVFLEQPIVYLIAAGVIEEHLFDHISEASIKPEDEEVHNMGMFFWYTTSSAKRSVIDNYTYRVVQGLSNAGSRVVLKDINEDLEVLENEREEEVKEERNKVVVREIKRLQSGESLEHNAFFHGSSRDIADRIAVEQVPFSLFEGRREIARKLLFTSIREDEISPSLAPYYKRGMKDLMMVL